MKTLEVYNVKCSGHNCRMLVSTTPAGICGVIDIPTPTGVIRVAAKMSLETMRAIASKMAPLIRQDIEQGDANDAAEVGGRKQRRTRRRKRRAKWKKRMKKVFSGKMIKGLGKVANKVLNSKLVKGAMKVAKFIPGYGQAISAAYGVASKAAKVASKLGKGKKGAKQAVSALRQVAERRAGPQARQLATNVFQGAQRFAGRFGRSSGIDARTATGLLDIVGSAYAHRYGDELEAIANQGAVTGAREMDIVTGAAMLWGSSNELDDLDAEVGRSRRSKRRKKRRKRFKKFLKFTTPPGMIPGVSGIDIVGSEDGSVFAKVRKVVFHRGYTPDAPLRDLYAEGLRALS